MFQFGSFAYPDVRNFYKVVLYEIDSFSGIPQIGIPKELRISRKMPYLGRKKQQLCITVRFRWGLKIHIFVQIVSDIT